MLNMSRPLARPDVYKAIADPTRRALLRELSRGEKSVTELLKPFAITMPALSRHLQVLRGVDLVRQERSGKQRLYRLNAKPLQEVSRWLVYFEQFWDKKLDGLALYLAASEKGKKQKPAKARKIRK
jgi:DNA-binding transcriptional ArsR family regulator